MSDIRREKTNVIGENFIMSTVSLFMPDISPLASLFSRLSSHVSLLTSLFSRLTLHVSLSFFRKHVKCYSKIIRHGDTASANIKIPPVERELSFKKVVVSSGHCFKRK